MFPPPSAPQPHPHTYAYACQYDSSYGLNPKLEEEKEMKQLNGRHKEKIIQINVLSSESGVEKRRLYDLFNVLTACGVCSKSGTHSYEWNGLSCIYNHLKYLAKETELLAQTTTATDLFMLKESPSIRSITTKFLMFYIFTGRNIANLRNVATLMGTDEKREKPFLRRLYLVAFLLERLGIIKHSKCNAEYEFTFDLDALVDGTIQTMVSNQEYPEDSFRNLMRTIPPTYLRSVQKLRIDTLTSYLLAKRDNIYINSPSMPDDIDEKINQ